VVKFELLPILSSACSGLTLWNSKSPRSSEKSASWSKCSFSALSSCMASGSFFYTSLVFLHEFGKLELLWDFSEFTESSDKLRFLLLVPKSKSESPESDKSGERLEESPSRFPGDILLIFKNLILIFYFLCLKYSELNF
jgi:hypothetical protein